MIRRLGAIGALTIVLLGMTVGFAPPAAAHARLVSTAPAAGERFDRAPDRVVLTFSEPVEAAFGAIVVHDEDAERVAPGRTTHPDGDRRAVALDLPALERGGYVVTWRVVSADGHPVRGAFAFRVGDPDGEDRSADLARRLLAAGGGSATVGAVFGVARAAVFAGLILLIGVTVTAVAFAPAHRARFRRLAGYGWIITATATVATIGLQGAYAAGLGLSAAVRPAVIESVIETRYGQVALARLAVLTVAAVLVARLLRAGDDRPSRGLLALSGAAGVGLALTPALAGHASTGDNVAAATVVDTVHVAAASVWIGGVVALVAVVLRKGFPDAEPVARSFSRVAVWAVGLVVVTGSMQGLRQTGSLDALRETTYGQILLVKVGLVAAIVLVAVRSRSTVRRTLVGLRRLVAVETGLAVAVVAATALLVNAVPARTALALPFSGTVEAGPMLVDVTVDPAAAGPTELHVYTLTRAGAVQEVDDLEVELQLLGRDVNPIDVPLQVAGPGHFAAYGFDLPVAGRWKLAVTAVVDGTTSSRGSLTFTVR